MFSTSSRFDALKQANSKHVTRRSIASHTSPFSPTIRQLTAHRPCSIVHLGSYVADIHWFLLRFTLDSYFSSRQLKCSFLTTCILVHFCSRVLISIVSFVSAVARIVLPICARSTYRLRQTRVGMWCDHGATIIYKLQAILDTRHLLTTELAQFDSVNNWLLQCCAPWCSKFQRVRNSAAGIVFQAPVHWLLVQQQRVTNTVLTFKVCTTSMVT